MKKIFSFVKGNIFMIFAIYWLVQFTIGLIAFHPSSLDKTARKIESIQLGLDLIWSLVFFIQHSFYKVIGLMNDKIDLVNKRVDIICDAITEAINAAKEEKEAAEKDEKEEKEVN